MYRESRTVKVNIYGMDYSITGDADPEHYREITKYVNDKMVDIAENSPIVSTVRIAALAALRITEELFDMRQGKVTVSDSRDGRLQKLIESIDKAIK